MKYFFYTVQFLSAAKLLVVVCVRLTPRKDVLVFLLLAFFVLHNSIGSQKIIILKMSLFLKYYLLFYQYLSLSFYHSVYLSIYCSIYLPNHYQYLYLIYSSINHFILYYLRPRSQYLVVLILVCGQSCCSCWIYCCLINSHNCAIFLNFLPYLYLYSWLSLTSHFCSSLAGWKKREGGRRVRDREIKG